MKCTKANKKIVHGQIKSGVAIAAGSRRDCGDRFMGFVTAVPQETNSLFVSGNHPGPAETLRSKAHPPDT